MDTKISNRWPRQKRWIRKKHWLLNKERIAHRALKLFDKKSAVVEGIPDPSSCTVSFQVVDKDGNAMSFVNRSVNCRSSIHSFQPRLTSPISYSRQ